MNEFDSLIRKSIKELENAELLIQHDSVNAAVSRTYYAMFYAVQVLFADNGIVTSSHSGAISTFSKKFISTGMLPKTLGRALNKIYEMRQTSDYNFTDFITGDKAIEVLNIGKDFVKTILEYVKNQNNRPE